MLNIERLQIRQFYDIEVDKFSINRHLVWWRWWRASSAGRRQRRVHQITDWWWWGRLVRCPALCKAMYGAVAGKKMVWNFSQNTHKKYWYCPHWVVGPDGRDEEMSGIIIMLAVGGACWCLLLSISRLKLTQSNTVSLVHYTLSIFIWQRCNYVFIEIKFFKEDPTLGNIFGLKI